MPYFVYILRCIDNTLYTGITTDLERRVEEHNTDDQKGARYTRARRPVTLVYSEKYSDKSTALKREVEIKNLSRAEKMILLKNT